MDPVGSASLQDDSFFFMLFLFLDPVGLRASKMTRGYISARVFLRVSFNSFFKDSGFII